MNLSHVQPHEGKTIHTCELNGTPHMKLIQHGLATIQNVTMQAVRIRWLGTFARIAPPHFGKLRGWFRVKPELFESV